MSNAIAVFGAGPGLGRAVAHRYARDGYDVALVGRRREPLDLLAEELIGAGTTAHAITADLSHADVAPQLAEQIRAKVGDLDALYYGPTSDGDFVPAVRLTPRRAEEFMPLGFYALVVLVQEFLPHMLDRGDGAILTAQGASTKQGPPNMSGPGPAQAAQRNYLQSLHAEVANKGVYVGMLCIGAAITTVPSIPRWRRPKPRESRSGRCPWSTPPISPTCSGICTRQGNRRKPVTPRRSIRPPRDERDATRRPFGPSEDRGRARLMGQVRGRSPLRNQSPT